MADYQPITETISNLTGICPDCEAIMNRRINTARIAQVCGKLEITFSVGLQRVVKSGCHSVNGDFGREASANGNVQPQK